MTGVECRCSLMVSFLFLAYSCHFLRSCRNLDLSPCLCARVLGLWLGRGPRSRPSKFLACPVAPFEGRTVFGQFRRERWHHFALRFLRRFSRPFPFQSFDAMQIAANEAESAYSTAINNWDQQPRRGENALGPCS